MDVCKSKIHHDQFLTNADGTLSWEEVECLGACVNAPMVMVFKDTYEDLTPDSLAALIDAFEAGTPPKPGPQMDRFYSAPESGFTSLLDEEEIKRNARAWRERAAEAAPEQPAAPAAPPSEAARPKTEAAETNPTVKSPSPVKTSQAAEAAESVKAPATDHSEANKAEPDVEGEAKQRQGKPSGKHEDENLKAPELLHGEKVGADAKSEAATSASTPGEGIDAARPAAKKSDSEGEAS
jgi:NADH-quinone oxidoreductase subunit E